MEDLSWLTSGPNKLILKTVASKNIIELWQAGCFDKLLATQHPYLNSPRTKVKPEMMFSKKKSRIPDLLFTTQTAPFRYKHPSLSFQHKSRKNIKDSAAIYHIRPEMHAKDPCLESQLFPG